MRKITLAHINAKAEQQGLIVDVTPEPFLLAPFGYVLITDGTSTKTLVLIVLDEDGEIDSLYNHVRTNKPLRRKRAQRFIDGLHFDFG